MIFDSGKRKQAVEDFFTYIESKVLPTEKHPEIISLIKEQLKNGHKLIERNEWSIAFENLARELVDNFLVIDREGTTIVKRVIKFCKVDENWEYDLRGVRSLGYKTGSWRLTDAEELAKNHKYTFYKPSREITKNLKVGNLVKLIFEFDSTNNEHPSAERMWVQITEIDGEQFKGTLDNCPHYLHELYYGDEITFVHKHIIAHDLDMSEPNLADNYCDRCFVTNKVLYEGAPINYIYRDEPIEIDEKDYVDSGWIILSGDESDEYMNDSENISCVSLGSVLSKDDSFVGLLNAEIGAHFARNENGIFKKIE